MGGSPSKCTGSLQFPYSSVNFWPGDTQSYFYPALASSTSSGPGSTPYECFGADSSGNPVYYSFSVALIGPGGSNYPCDNIDFSQSQANAPVTLNCPGVSRDSLSAGSYNLAFTTQGQTNNGPTFTITRSNRASSCANSVSFPDRQASFNFRTDDPNVAFTTVNYSAYQCAAIQSCFQSNGGCAVSAYLSTPGSNLFDESQSSGLPDTSASADPFSSPKTTRFNFFNQLIRGNAQNGQYSTGINFYDPVANANDFTTTSYDFTITHNNDAPAVPSNRGFKRRQDLEICPLGHSRCLIPGTSFTECLDTQTNLEACGGCPGTNSSVDCTLLSDVDTMSCVAGVCQAQASTEDWGLHVQ